MLLHRTVATWTVTGVAVAALATLAGCSSDSGSSEAAPSSSASSPDAPASSSAPTGPTYVALGDSYTAAPGVPDTDLTTGCARSSNNYPSLVAAELGAQLIDVSCSGASTLNLVGVQQNNGVVIPPQFDAVTPDVDVVTLGMGGNDEELFSTLVGTCAQLASSDPEGSPCRDRAAAARGGKDPLVKKTTVIGDRVTAALTGIRDRAPDAQVVLVGYPQPVPGQGTCSILPLATGDYPYVRSITAKLNDALRKAAKATDTTYVDVGAASAGHDICAGTNAWVNGLQTDMSKAVAFHPFANEQQAVAEMVLEKLER